MCVKYIRELSFGENLKEMEDSLLGEITQTNPFEILENRVREEMKLEFIEIYNNNETFYKKWISFLIKSIEQKDKEIEELKKKFKLFLERKTDLNN
jgi:vacuolar-type H+-ATPase subunit I/STV1